MPQFFDNRVTKNTLMNKRLVTFATYRQSFLLTFLSLKCHSSFFFHYKNKLNTEIVLFMFEKKMPWVKMLPNSVFSNVISVFLHTEKKTKNNFVWISKLKHFYLIFVSVMRFDNVQKKIKKMLETKFLETFFLTKINFYLDLKFRLIFEKINLYFTKSFFFSFSLCVSIKYGHLYVMFK